MYYYIHRKVNTKHAKKQFVNKWINLDMQEYFDERDEILCGCKYPCCNPYYGDRWEYFIMLDELRNNVSFLN